MMKKIMSDVLKYYDIEIVNLIVDKYDMSYMDAFKNFISSETYKMLSNVELWMFEFGPSAIFDMWESERKFGNPRESIYLRSLD